MARKLRKSRKWQPLSTPLLWTLCGVAGASTTCLALWLGAANVMTALLLVALAELFLLSSLVLVTLWAERLTEVVDSWEAADDEPVQILPIRESAPRQASHCNNDQVLRYLRRVGGEMSLESEHATRSTPPRSRMRRAPATSPQEGFPTEELRMHPRRAA